VSGLLACPFCRDVVATANARTCDECDVLLVPLEELPPHVEDFHEGEDGAENVASDPPQDVELPLSFMRRGRGALLTICVLGFAAFFAPWCYERAPELKTWTGYSFAAGPLTWLWGGVVGWFVMFPLVLTRRSVSKMRGARVICTSFAAMTAIEAFVLLLLSRPDPESLVPIAFTWAWGLYASLGLSLAGIFVALRLGGRLYDLSDLPHAKWTQQKRSPTTSRRQRAAASQS
jgi:hypothetical protein